MMLPNALPFAGFLLLWAFVLFVLFDIKQIDKHSVTSTDVLAACADREACYSLHVQNPVLQELLRQRCNLEERSAQRSAYDQITFTHVPKAGGSSVREHLQRNAPGRSRTILHEHLDTSMAAAPNNIFATLLRDPVAKAISFFSYAKDCPKFPPHEQNNRLWQLTYHANPVTWSADKDVQHLLSQDPLDLFLRRTENGTDGSAMARMAKAPLKDTLPGAMEAFLHYTSALPPEFQCRQHMEVGFILLKHYEVVGTLERVTDFYRVLSRRAQIKASTKSSDPLHINRSKYQHRTLSKAERSVMEANLQAPLYCATVLWKIAGLINEADMKCVK